MTELELRRTDRGLAPVEGFGPETYGDGAMRLVEWAREAQAAHELATALCETPFAGQFARNPGAATAAILKGAEVGLTPVTSLGAFDLIQGTPAPKAITLRALVQSHGHEVIIDSSTDLECKARGRRRGSSEWQHVTWTIKQAQALGLAGKDNWKKQPKAMLVARATGEVCRLIASDVILGIGYSSEEVKDEQPEPTRRVQRARPEVVVLPEPSLDPQTDSGAETPQTDPAPESPDGITSSQLKKLGAQMREVGLTERSDALAYVADVIGREVTSRNDLTKDEASRVIDALDRDLAPTPEPDPHDGNDPWATP